MAFAAPHYCGRTTSRLSCTAWHDELGLFLRWGLLQQFSATEPLQRPCDAACLTSLRPKCTLATCTGGRSSSNGGWLPLHLSWATHQLTMAWQYMRQSVAGTGQTEHDTVCGQGSVDYSSWLGDQPAASGQLSWIPQGIRALPSKVPQLWHRQEELGLPLTNQDAMQLDTQLAASSRRHSAHEGE